MKYLFLTFFLLLLFAFPSQISAQSTIDIIQKNEDLLSGTSTSHDVTYNTTPTANDLLVIGIKWGGDNVFSHIDNSGWEIATQLSQDFLLAYKIAGESEPTKITFNWDTAPVNGVWVAAQFDNILTNQTTVLDRISTTQTSINDSMALGPTAEISEDVELALAFIAKSGSSAGGWSWTNSFVHEDFVDQGTATSGNTIGYAWYETETIENISTTGSFTNTSLEDGYGAIVTFRSDILEPTPTPTEQDGASVLLPSTNTEPFIVLLLITLNIVVLIIGLRQRALLFFVAGAAFTAGWAAIIDDDVVRVVALIFGLIQALMAIGAARE